MIKPSSTTLISNNNFLHNFKEIYVCTICDDVTCSDTLRRSLICCHSIGYKYSIFLFAFSMPFLYFSSSLMCTVQYVNVFVFCTVCALSTCF